MRFFWDSRTTRLPPYFLLLLWPHLALLLSQERLHLHWSWYSCFLLWPAHLPQYVNFFFTNFSSDSFISPQLSVELFLVAISHLSYVLTTSRLTIISRTSTFASTCFTLSRALPFRHLPPQLLLTTYHLTIIWTSNVYHLPSTLTASHLTIISRTSTFPPSSCFLL